MNYSEPPSQPDPEQTQEFVSARARRRRALRRAYFPTDEAGRAALFTHLAKRAFPSYELFVFSLVAGVILGVGYFFDSQGLLIFGVLVAPLLTPWIGMSLAIVAGAGRMFAQTFLALLVSALLFFGSGILAGFASRISQPRTFNEAFVHSRLWWPDLVVLAIGAILITISFVRSEERPYLPSALVAYELFLPLCAAGFGLGSGVVEIWPQGLLVFFVHFAWATFFSIITLFFLRFFPTSVGGFSFTGVVIIILIAWLTSSTGALNWMMIRAGLATPEAVPVVQPTSTLALIPTITASPSPEPATAVIGVPTLTPSRTPRPTQQATLPPTQTPTFTVTAEPTPIIALIRASEGGGAFIREKPGGIVLATLGNGSVVTIIPNDLQEVGSVVWVHVFTTVNDVRVEGWMIQSVLVTATPVADWEPSATSPATSTP
ncbi:MAG: hypothetical protein C3F07_21350 [Anaerolineales bacterium]|nr:DUF389 domain-containing protein [Anaerolineae bacterium]PWB68737.1 MAG: hypothetical protein C3F07_21350 [Anaerolineales bacterium]